MSPQATSLPSSPQPSSPASLHITPDTSSSPPPPSPAFITHRICISHFLSAWNSRIFEFGAILFLVACFPATLLPVSLYALGRSFVGFLVAPALGVLVDSGDRLAVIRAAILGQRVAVVLSCAVFYVLYISAPSPPSSVSALSPPLRVSATPPDSARLLLLIPAILLACIEKLAATLSTLAVERDWLVVLSTSNTPLRTTLNTRMRQIDLLCKLGAPLLIALLDTYARPPIAILATGLSSLLAVVPETLIIARLHAADARLHRPSAVRPTRIVAEVAAALARPVRAAAAYFAHPACLPSLALALLYLTVLSLGGAMVAFLRGAAWTSAQIGAARVAGSAVELSATLVAPWLVARIGPVRAGIWCLSWQTGWLGVGLAWLFTGSESAVGGLVVGVILSRLGLWGYDFVGQIIVQDEVGEHHRGAFSATEASLQNLCELVAFASTAVYSRPEDFGVPAVLSFSAVATACALYAQFVRERRGHLFHAPQCLKTREAGYARLAA
ncbi:hypothetical protein TD95_000281, partial [Thielaviopsis punctulata]